MLLLDGTEQLRPPHPIALRAGVAGNGIPVQRRAPAYGIPRQIQPRLPLDQPHPVFELNPVLPDEDAEENAARHVVHVEEIDLALAAFMLRRACEVRTRADHLGRPSLELLLVRADPELRCDAGHLFARAPDDAVPHLVAEVRPARRGTDRVVGAHVVEQLDHGLRLGRRIHNRGLALGALEQCADVAVVVGGGLGERFGDDGGLLELDAEP